MANTNDPPTQGARRAGWRGARGDGARVARYRWQDDASLRPIERLRARRQWRWVKVSLLAAVFLGLTGWLVYFLLHRPAQTPLVAAVATGYAWPLPPNGWAHEDLEALAELGGQSLHVVRTDHDWNASPRGLDGFDAALRRAAARAAASGALIVYVSMHGAVDDSGRACLIPPSAAPLRAETWIPVAGLLSKIRDLKLRDDCAKLVVLDACRIGVDWRLGSLYAGFAERLDDAVREAAVPNLAVLCAASHGETSAAERALGSSLFGRYFTLGLAGAADRSEHGGNADRRVSLAELHRYLASAVDRASLLLRGSSQRPILVPATAKDVPIAWATSGSTQRRLAETLSSRAASEASIDTAEIAALWNDRDRLAARLEPTKYDPLAWRDFEHRLLWLEQLAGAGAAYAAAARSVYAELEELAGRFEKRAAEAERYPRSPWPRQLEAVASTVGLDRLRLPSVALDELFSQLSQAEAAEIASLAARLEESPSRENLASLVARLDAHAATSRGVEAHVARWLAADPSKAAWPTLAPAARCLVMRFAAEAATTPSDLRVLPWIHSSADAGDRARRMADDHMWIGGAESLAAASAAWLDAAGRYDEARRAETRLAEALAACDRTLAELPYLAEWVARPNVDAAEAARMDEAINDRLLPLIDRCQTLGLALAAPAEQIDVDLAHVTDQARQLDEDFDQLRSIFDAEGQRLIQSADRTGATVAAIDCLLASPLPAARDRELLISRRNQLQGALAAEVVHNAAAPSAGDAHAENPAPPSYLERAVNVWRRHPALAIVDPSHTERVAVDPENAAGQSRSLAAVNAMNRRLRHDLDGVDAILAHSDEASALEGDDSPTLVRPALAAAELTARRTAALVSSSEVNVVWRARVASAQQLLVWHAERTLDDFYGPVEPGSKSFFDAATLDLLNAADAMALSTQRLGRHRGRLEAILAERRGLAADGLQTRPDDVLLVGVADSIPTAITLIGASPTGSAFPAGLAAVYLADELGRIHASTRSVDLSADLDASAGSKLQLDLVLPGADLAERGPVLDGVTWFRGHRYAGSCLLRPPGGVAIEVAPHQYGAPQITLSGPDRRQASIVFILNVSQSMSALAQLEAPGGEQVTRLEVARRALKTMLDRLAADGRSQVGVRFYGHRAGWNTRQPDQLLLQLDYARPIPQDVRPSEDVEVVLPLGRFDTIIAGGVAKALDSIKPWGESPLYLAVSEAAADFAAAPADAAKSIVVVTDGANYQYNSPNPRNLDDVLAAVAPAGIPVHIVGFQIEADEREQARREFGQLAEQSGGSFVEATSAATLLATLDSLLGPTRFEVRDARDRRIARGEVGDTLVVPWPPAASGDVVVMAEAAAVPATLAGGEALELVLVDGSRRIESIRYERGLPRFVELVTGAFEEPSPWLAGIHRPSWTNDGVRFAVSYQRADRLPAERPAEVWIDVAPLAASGEPLGPTFTFYDANYEPSLPAPVVEFVARGWPDQATGAAISAQCSLTPAPSHRVPLAEVLATPAADALSIDGLHDVAFQIQVRGPAGASQSFQIGVVERYAADARLIPQARVELYPPPARVVHRYDPANRLATHLFEVAATDERALATYELRFTRRSDFEREALHAIDPIEVGVARESDVLRLVPASGRP